MNVATGTPDPDPLEPPRHPENAWPSRAQMIMNIHKWTGLSIPQSEILVKRGSLVCPVCGSIVAGSREVPT